MSLSRQFTVEGIIECVFKPEETQSESFQPGIDVELWYKSPLNVLLLGKGQTDGTGKFSITFQVDESQVSDGKLTNAFVKLYYKGILVNGDNPYIDDPGFIELEG